MKSFLTDKSPKAWPRTGLTSSTGSGSLAQCMECQSDNPIQGTPKCV
jgi:hypothetical protein